MQPARTIGIAGAGTMGSGIAQLALQTGADTRLYDPDPQAREHGLGTVRSGIARAAAKGRADPDAAERLRLVADLTEFSGCDLVIEAAPERLELKHQLFGSLAPLVGDACVLATNTSSLSVTAVASGVPRPERVVGMHFFNPAPIMRLIEVVAGEVSSAEALALARATGEAMGKRVIEAADVAGFIVNRCNRPFVLEGLRLVEERVATMEQVDRICRMGGGFRMGPFELMDLVGLDVGLEIGKSFYEQSFGEPRWHPSPLTARRVAAGHLGRKTGRGWYEHPHKPVDPDPPEPGGGDGVVVIAGDIPLAGALHEAAAAAGWDVVGPEGAGEQDPALVIDCGAADENGAEESGPRLILCDVGPLAALDPEGEAAGFFCLPPLGRLVELTRGPRTSPEAQAATERFFATLGIHAEWVEDAPGLVLGRIVGQLVNEACFAVGEGVGSPADIDAGMVLGLNHPRGPLEWGDVADARAVLAVVAGLQEELREERYRPAPALVRAVRHQRPLRPDLAA
jgi:3-hydroxybutyryl-CoA dehydrogenase